MSKQHLFTKRDMGREENGSKEEEKKKQVGETEEKVQLR